jgi:hypothetical protein
MALQKAMLDQQKAKGEIAKTDVETRAANAKEARDALAGVTDQASYDNFLNVGRQRGWEVAKQAPPQFDAKYVRDHVMTADKFIEQSTPKFEKVDVGGQIKMVDVNPVTNPSIRTMDYKKVIGPEAALHARVQAATQDPFGNLGIRDMVEAQVNGAGGARPAAQPSVGATAGLADLHGDDFLKTLPRAQSDQIKALADGRLQFPTGQALRTPYWQNMVSQVAQYDPSFDAINYNARSATRKAFTSGAESKSINALNTVMGHLDELDKAAKDLNNSGFTLWNEYVSNPVAGAFSPEFKGRLNKFNLTKQAVVDEMEKAYRGSSGAQGGIEAWKKTLSSADSYQALRSSIQQGVKLYEAAIDQLMKEIDAARKSPGTVQKEMRDRFTGKEQPQGAAEPGKAASGGIKFLGWEK